MQFVINKSLFEVNQAPLFEATLSAPPSVFSPVQSAYFSLFKTTVGTHILNITTLKTTKAIHIQDLENFAFPTVLLENNDFIDFLQDNKLSKTNLNFTLIDTESDDPSAAYCISDKFRVISNLDCYGVGAFEDGENVIYGLIFDQGNDVWVVSNGLTSGDKLDIHSIAKKKVKKLIKPTACGHLDSDCLQEVLKRLGMITAEQRHFDEEDVILGDVKANPNNSTMIGNIRLYGHVIHSEDVDLSPEFSNTTLKCIYFEETANVMAVVILEKQGEEFKMIYTDRLLEWMPEYWDNIPHTAHGKALIKTLPTVFKNLGLAEPSQYLGYLPVYNPHNENSEPFKMVHVCNSHITDSKSILGDINIRENKTLIVLDHPTQAQGFEPLVYQVNYNKEKVKKSSIEKMEAVLNHYAHQDLDKHNNLISNLARAGYFEK